MRPKSIEELRFLVNSFQTLSGTTFRPRWSSQSTLRPSFTDRTWGSHSLSGRTWFSSPIRQKVEKDSAPAEGGRCMYNVRNRRQRYGDADSDVVSNEQDASETSQRGAFEAALPRECFQKWPSRSFNLIARDTKTNSHFICRTKSSLQRKVISVARGP